MQQGLVRHSGVSNFSVGQLRRIQQITRDRLAAMPDDDWRKSAPAFTEPELTGNLALADRLQAVAARHDTSPGAVAVAWTLRHPAVYGAITGFRRPDQVDPIVSAASLELTDQDITEIEG